MNNAQHSSDYSIGNLGDCSDIFEVYASQSMAQWRGSLLTYGPKSPPCDTCMESNEPATVEHELVRRELERQFKIDKSIIQSPKPRNFLNSLRKIEFKIFK